MRRSFCLISLATNMLEGWDIFHLKGELCLQYKNVFLQYFEAGIKANRNGILLDCKDLDIGHLYTKHIQD